MVVRVKVHFLCSSEPSISSTNLDFDIALTTMIRSFPASRIMYHLAQPITLLHRDERGLRLLCIAFPACVGGHKRPFDTHLIAFGDSSKFTSDKENSRILNYFIADIYRMNCP
jgi:hypothetical protein